MGRGSFGAAAPLGVSRDDDDRRSYSTKRGAFHEVFNLPESEPPLTGGGGTAQSGVQIEKILKNDFGFRFRPKSFQTVGAEFFPLTAITFFVC